MKKIKEYLQTLDVSNSDIERITIEAIRCKGNDGKERSFIRRVWSTLDEYYWIAFYEVSGLTKYKICDVGPFTSGEDTKPVYNKLVLLFDFNKDTLCEIKGFEWDVEDDVDWEDLDWEESEETLDWGDEEDELDWGLDDEEDEDDLDW